MRNPPLLSILLFLNVSILPTFTTSGSVAHVPIQITNESGHGVEIYWVNVHTNELVLLSDPNGMQTGTTFGFNSFAGHSFEAREAPNERTGMCKDSECHVGYFTVNENADQVLFIRHNMELEHTDKMSIAEKSSSRLMGDCEVLALEAAVVPNANSTRVISDLKECVETSVTSKFAEANEEIAFQAKVRESMSSLLENYTCADESLPTSEFIDTEDWYYKGVSRKVGVFHSREASKIHLISDFVTEEECDAMEQAAQASLHQATTADGEGGHKLSESRKAMQAGITVPWNKEIDGDPIARLSRKIYDYTNHATGFDIDELGQEDLMSIQYFGRGDNDIAPDRYTPHCDGDCTGLPLKSGNRVATMVVYCTVPEKGGSTQFMNSGIHIRPTKGNGIFFSYMNADTKVMDKGFTQHSGCPVITGIKRIVTQWMRFGVSRQDPWTSFNTLGIKYSDTTDD